MCIYKYQLTKYDKIVKLFLTNATPYLGVYKSSEGRDP